MNIDPEMLKQLIETFSAELEEQLQVITAGLLALEKLDKNSADSQPIFEKIFRAAHNIKGAARGIGITDVGEIAHHIESLFSSLQKHTRDITENIISLSLQAVDSMKLAMAAFVSKSPLPFDLNVLLTALTNGAAPTSKTKPTVPESAPAPIMDSIEQSSIRVSLHNLENVASIVEEIQINKIALHDHNIALTQLISKIHHYDKVFDYTDFEIKNLLATQKNDELLKIIQHSFDFLTEIRHSVYQLHKSFRPQINTLSLLSNNLQEEVRLLRLVPVATLLHSFPRYARDLSQELNKAVNLRITGDDVKIDKLVLEGLKDPLMHLIRNAIDHGLENSEERTAAHKNSTGEILVSVKEKGNKILFDISDDGRGIDAESIGKIAMHKNLISPTELATLSQSEILELIFHPGFSTKEIITAISGRGVGLDVVKSNVIKLKGSVAITTEIHKGTTFHLQVPLTLASEHGLLVNCSDQAFVVPAHTIDRVLLLDANQIINIEGAQAVLVDNHPVILRSLAQTLNLPIQEVANKNKLPLVILKKDAQSVAMLVDEILGEREIVIKPLLPPLNDVASLVGGTLASNGEIIMVLNPDEILNLGLRDTKRHCITSVKSTEVSAAKPHILVVDDSITTRTLEKNILESKNYQVTIAVNGKEAWDLLQKQKFSLLITDVMMPIMDGFTLTEKVKQHTSLKDLPVIIVTSLGSNDEKKRGISVGANAYIVKNEFESGALLEVVSQLVLA